MRKCTDLVELEKLLQNAYFLANFGFDTAENEASSILTRTSMSASSASWRAPQAPPSSLFSARSGNLAHPGDTTTFGVRGFQCLLCDCSYPCLNICRQSRLSRVATTTTDSRQTADSTSRFGLGIFPAGGGPAGRRRIGDFPGRRRGGPAGRRRFGDFPGRRRSGRSALDWGFSGYEGRLCRLERIQFCRTFVPHIFL